MSDGKCLLFPPTLIWRHKRERLSKCSLRGLEDRSDFRFFRYPDELLPDLSQYVLLTLDAPPLTLADASHGLLILDGTWRYAQRMERQLAQSPLRRSIPAGLCTTAYPRKQTACSDPCRGLASIEALYVAYRLLDRPVSGLLDRYVWGSRFLELNFTKLASC